MLIEQKLTSLFSWQVENPDGSAKPLDQETEEGIDGMLGMFMDRLKTSGMYLAVCRPCCRQ